MSYSVIALIVNLFGFTMLAYVLSRARRSDSWLILLFLVMAFQVGESLTDYVVEQNSAVMTAADKQFADSILLVGSAMSTYLLAMAALNLMGKKGYLIQIGVLFGYGIQVYSAVTHATVGAFKVFSAMDVGTCLIAGGLFGIALARRIEKPILSMLALFFPILWGGSDLLFWCRDHFSFIGQVACDTGMTSGAFGTAIVAAIFAYGADPKDGTPPTAPAQIPAAAPATA